MPMLEDLDAFLDTADFATAATFNGTAVNLNLDDDYSEPLGGFAEDRSISALGKTAALAGVRHGDTIVAEGITYKVRRVAHDNFGMTRLTLEKQ